MIFRQFQENEDLQKLNELIRDNPQKKFVLLSPVAVPGVFRAFQYTGDMMVYWCDEIFCLTEMNFGSCFLGYNIKLTDSDVNEMLKESYWISFRVFA